MNKNVLIAVVVVILLVVGGVFIFGKKGSTPSQNNTMEMTPTSTTGTTSTTNTTAPSSAATQPTAAGNAVTIQNFAFTPSTITIHPGDSITWTNMDSAPHSATADDGSFDTGVLQKGEAKTLKFSSMGTFTYHCSVHPNMKAKIVVQ